MPDPVFLQRRVAVSKEFRLGFSQFSASVPALPRRPCLLFLGVRACSSSASVPALPRRPCLLFLGVRACSSSASVPALPRRPCLLFLGVRACFFLEFRACFPSASGPAFSRSSGLAVSSEFRLAFLRIPALSFRQLRRILSRPNFLPFVLFCAAYVVSLYDIPAGKSAPLNKRSFRCV